MVLGIVFLLCMYRNKKDTQKRAGLLIGMNPIIRHSGNPFDPSRFTFRKTLRSRPSIARSLLGRFEKPPLHTPTNPDVHRSTGNMLSKGAPNAGNNATENDVLPVNPQQITPAMIDAALRTRRADLERRLRAVEQELRDMGVEPRRGPPGPSVSPAMLQTRVYIEYRRLQGEMEEPPPEYSEG